MISFMINRNASDENETLQLASRPQLVDMTVPTVSDSEVKKLRAMCIYSSSQYQRIDSMGSGGHIIKHVDPCDHCVSYKDTIYKENG